MDLQQLKTFFTVAKNGSFSKAVEQLKLSQPAISRQVMLLEDSLGVRLFNRHARRGLVLTSEGETLLHKTSSILKEVETLKESLREDSEPKGLLRIATSHFHASTWLTSCIANFIRSYSSISVHIMCRDGGLDLSLREADLYIGTYNYTLVGHEQDLLFQQNLQLFSSQSYVDNHGLPETISDLKNHRLLNFPYPTTDRFDRNHQWIVRMASSGSPNNIVLPILTVDSIEALIKTTKEGLGIAALPPFIARFNQTDFLPVLSKEKSEPLGVYCTYLTQSRDRPSVKAFIEFLKNSCSSFLKAA